MNPAEHSHDVIVVGGGIAGLTAAIELAGHGRRVLVLDARSRTGGRARTVDHDGFLLNEGAHALYVDGPAWRFLDRLGRLPAGGVPEAAGGIGVDGEVAGVLPGGVISLLRSPLIRGDRLGFARLFAGLGRLDTSRYDRVTVADATADLLGAGRGARVARALLRLATYGHDPEVASAGPALAQLRQAATSGVRYLDGGWQTIVDSLRAEAVDRGVELRTGAKVSGVVETGDGVELRVGGETLTAGVAVLAAGGPGSLTSLLAAPSAEVARRAAEARPCTVACLDIGLRRPWGDHPSFALGIDRPLYLSVHAPVADLAPGGSSLVHVMRYHHPDETPDAAADRAECDALLDRVRPGWRHDVAYEGFRQRLVAAHDQPRASAGGLAGRPGVAVPGHTRVLVAGDWVGGEGLLVDASVASSREAASAALGIIGRARAAV